METFPALLAICAWNLPVTGEFPTQRQVTLMFSLICAWVNNRKAGDLRDHRHHYDVTVMLVEMNYFTDFLPLIMYYTLTK